LSYLPSKVKNETARFWKTSENMSVS